MTSLAARPWIILGLIFLLGAITGSLLTIGFGPRPGPPGAQQMGSHWMRHLTERLKLSDDQQKQIEPWIMDAEQREDRRRAAARPARRAQGHGGGTRAHVFPSSARAPWAG
jgi:Spy/CpxP family protein refolding chaperone